MTGFRLRTFGGKAPKIFARLLPEDMAQTATNVRLDSGRLEPWKDNATATITPVGSYAITGSTKTLFKFNSSIWIGSNSALDIVRSPLAEDPHERIYISGLGGSTGYPRMTTSAIVGNTAPTIDWACQSHQIYLLLQPTQPQQNRTRKSLSLERTFSRTSRLTEKKASHVTLYRVKL